MKTALGLIMIANAVLFIFGAVQHIGVAVGPFHEPRIIPAAIVETICAMALGWGGAAVLAHAATFWRTGLIANFIALAGVLLGVVALALGAGPRTASNDLYHGIMLVLIAASLVILFLARSALQHRR